MYSMSRGVVSEPGLSGVEPEAMFVSPSCSDICPAMLLSRLTARLWAVTNRITTDALRPGTWESTCWHCASMAAMRGRAVSGDPARVPKAW